MLTPLPYFVKKNQLIPCLLWSDACSESSVSGPLPRPVNFLTAAIPDFDCLLIWGDTTRFYNQLKFKGVVIMNLVRTKLVTFLVRVHDKTELKCRSPWLYRVVIVSGSSKIDCSFDSMMSLTLTDDNSIIWLDLWHDRRVLFTWDVPLHVAYTFDSHYHLIHTEYL